MQMLIKNLLDFSKATIDADNYVDTDFNEVVSSIINDLEIRIQQNGATIKVSNLPTVKVIPEQIRQLFQNLITNALKFRKPDATPVINITAEKTKGMYISSLSYDQYEESFYKITVSDNGIGFEDKYADQIFLLFKRLHTFEEFEGTGIGLSICKKIVEKHNGYIYATSKPGEGATFTIILPVVFKNIVKPAESIDKLAV